MTVKISHDECIYMYNAQNRSIKLYPKMGMPAFG